MRRPLVVEDDCDAKPAATSLRIVDGAAFACANYARESSAILLMYFAGCR